MLLRDGRTVSGGFEGPREYFYQRLSTGRTTQPIFLALPEATAHCEQWFETRRLQKDFDGSEVAAGDSAEQAALTLRTE
jgi:hypothetical protein